MKYVIIGNSAAGIGCVEAIREEDGQGEIIIISTEPYHTYSRPAISYLLYEKTTEEKMRYRPLDFYDNMKCKTLFGKTVEKIEPDKKYVQLDDGKEIEYDKLLIATGSRPFVPPIEGLSQVKKQHTFLSLDDAKGLGKEITPASRVLIMGAGLIGLKCAEGIAHLVKHIDIVDLADRVLPSVLDEKAATLVQKHMEQKNITFYLSDGVKRFEGNEAILASGKRIAFDVLVIAVGVRPNIEIAKAAGIQANKGIHTDEHCRTSIEDIYAAGDCTESYDITTDTLRPLALLPNAYMQGECAGINMAGGEKRYDKAIPMNAIGFFGLHIITAGDYTGEDYIEQDEGTYKRLVTKDGVLKGFILVGNVARAGIYTALIRERTPLDTLDYDLIKQKPQLMAFSKKERSKKLGGAER